MVLSDHQSASRTKAVYQVLRVQPSKPINTLKQFNKIVDLQPNPADVLHYFVLKKIIFVVVIRHTSMFKCIPHKCNILSFF